jgi:ribosomal protein S1
MFDKIKKLFSSSADTQVVENREGVAQVENAETPDFFEMLFDKILETRLLDKQLPCKIFYFKGDELTVKVGGLYAYLPLDQMPWNYPDKSYWKYIFSSLAGKEFKCKITEASREENQRFSIRVDASNHLFREVELMEDAEYAGIVLDKTEDAVLIDIGSHFRWKYGSLTGWLPLSDLANPESAQRCESGEKIKIIYKETNEKGLVFTNAVAEDLAAEYVGKIVWVQVCKVENMAPYFLVRGKYKADLPITDPIYPGRKKKVQRLRNEWINGDIINCEVLDFKPNRGLIVKWISDDPEDIDWTSDDMIDYIGREVDVNVSVSDEGTTFLVENKYPATLSARNRSSKKSKLSDGEVIHCRICSIDLNNDCFKIIWLIPKLPKE